MSILRPTTGLTGEGLYKIINSDRAKFAAAFYDKCTTIQNTAKQLVGFALTDQDLETVLNLPMVKGKVLANDFFKRYSKEASLEVGRFILVGLELDTFFDLAAGVGRSFDKR